MKTSFMKKLAFASCLLIFTSAASAASCKIKVSYSNFPFSPTIVGGERYTISHNSTSTTLRKHMRVVRNYGSHDVSIRYWNASGNKSTIIKKGRTKRVSGDLKKTTCLNTPKDKVKQKKRLDFKGHGVWRSNSTSRPKGLYTRIEETTATCKNLCLRSTACTGIEYTIVYANHKKNICELHTDKFHHLDPNYNSKGHAKVWLKNR